MRTPQLLFSSRRIFFFVGLLLCLCNVSCHAQAEATVKKSKKTQMIEGKKYYLHTVEKGQTLYAIAKAYGLSVNDILLENPEAMNNQLHPGQVLRIPAEKPVAAVQKDTTFFIHKVEAGETVYSIAHKYNVTEEDITRLNPEAKSGLKVGQDLKIPGKNPGQVGITPVITPPVAHGDSLYVGKKKDVYNIALMLPLMLGTVDAIKPDDPNAGLAPKQEAAVEFYEGALLAIDSMRHRGMHVEVHVYDMDEGDSSKVQSVLANPEFSSMDLIIGPLSPGPFYVASQWAKEHHVAIVSPVSPANRVLFHCPESSKTFASQSTQMEQLADHLAVTNKNDNIVLISSGNAKEQPGCNAFKTTMNKLLFPDGHDSIRSTKGFAGLESQLKVDRMNVLVIPCSSQAFVTDLLRLINGLADKYPITVYGMSTWMNYDNLDYDYLQTLQLHFVTPWFVDYDSSATVKNFVHKYNQVFGGDPGQYVFAGYDVTLFFLDALFTYGTDFYLKLPELKGDGLQQRFDFVKSDAESGYENRGVRIVAMKDYRLKEEK